MMRRAFSSFLGSAAILLASACVEVPEPEPESNREPPEGTLVYEGECARVFRSFDGFICDGTAARLDARACLVRDYLGGKPDLPRIDLYVTENNTYVGDWCGNEAGGCANGTVAYGYERVMNHEIVHALVAAITGHHAHSIIDEGLAHMLEGRTSHSFEEPDLESLLAINSGRAHRAEATNFLGWMLTTYGPEVVMEVARDAPLSSAQAVLEAALVEHLGLPIEEIIEAYEAEFAWMYPELPPLPAPVLPEEWADGIEMTLECAEAGTQGLSDEPYMWRTIDFVVDEPGDYLFLFDDARAVWVEEVCEEPYFEDGDAPCEEPGFWQFGFFYLQLALEPGRRYRARIEVHYPGPLNYTFLPLLGAEP